MSETDRRINAAIGRLERLAVKVPAAIDALLDQRRKIDGWGSGGGEVHVQHTAELTPTESAYAQREHIDRQIANLYDELDAIRCIARHVERDCDRYLAAGVPVVEEPKPRCDGGIGRTGYLEWGDPACTNIPEPYRKQCSRCRKAEDRWLVAHGERRHIGNDV